jgi:hypothetical protein
MKAPTMEEVAELYNDHARLNPSNPPTRREVAAWAGVSVSTAQKWLEVLEARGRLCYPIRRQHREVKA